MQDGVGGMQVSTLLALIDGLDDLGHVVVIGATNRVEALDPALRRPGRSAWPTQNIDEYLVYHVCHHAHACTHAQAHTRIHANTAMHQHRQPCIS